MPSLPRTALPFARDSVSPHFLRFLPVLIPLLAAATARPAEPDRDAIALAIQHLSETRPGYPRAADFLKRLEAATSPAELAALQREALVEASGIAGQPMLVVRRDPKQMGLPQTWQGNCALPGRGYDDEIARLEKGALKTLFKPEKGAFVGDVDLHFNGDRLLFSMPHPKNNWHIWEIRADGTGLRQLTPDEPGVDHYDACYLPDDRILFASTAAYAGVPCVGGGNRVANLYRMDADGANIRRLCFDQEHNWCPTVMNDGRVMYTRWEYTDTPHYFTRLLFRMNPDGTGQAEHYGSNSYWPNSIFYARPLPGHPTKFVAVVSGHHGVARMGELVVFDPALGRREDQGAVQRIPGRGKSVEPRIRDQLVQDAWPRFLHPFPLDDKRFLVSCQPSPNAPWGIYLADVFDNLVKIHDEPGRALLEPVPLRASTRPPVIPDRVRPGEKEATVYLTDIYQGDGLKGVPRGTVKKLRVYSYHYAYPNMGGHIHIGVDGPWDARRILGTVPVAADGSAVFKVPANTPLALQPLDADGQAIQIMRSWFTAMPGETVTCMGCHESQNAGPATRPVIAAARPPVDIEPWLGPERPFSFTREVQPVLDQSCVGCHDGTKAGAPNFTSSQPKARSGGPAPFNASYLALHPFVRRPGPESDYHLPRPYEYHASTSELVRLLRGWHYNVKLDDESWSRLITWIDLNVPDHGIWGEHRPVPNEFARLRREAEIKYGGRDIDPEAYPTPAPAPRAYVAPAAAGAVAAAAKIPSYAPPPAWPPLFELEREGGRKLKLILVPGERPCYLADREVSNEEYALFDPAHDSGYVQIFNKDTTSRGVAANSPRMPVARVTWNEANAYCEWLSAKTGKSMRLPSEAAWETACRAGTQTPMWYGDTTAPFNAVENLADASLHRLTTRDSPPWLPAVVSVHDGSTGPAATARYKPNPWGFHDMHGNVAEWTAGAEGDHRVARGGSFYDRPVRATATERRLYLAHQPVFDVGFRICWEPGPNDFAEK